MTAANRCTPATVERQVIRRQRFDARDFDAVLDVLNHLCAHNHTGVVIVFMNQGGFNGAAAEDKQALFDSALQPGVVSS
jgi:hypothetical protein